MVLSIHTQIAEKFSLPQDLVKTVIVFILSILISPIFHKINDSKFRLLFSLIPGLLFTFYIVQYWAFYVIATSLVPYIGFKILPKKALLISFITSFFFVLYIHVHRYMYDYMSWKIDCSVTVMYLITKVTYYAHWLQKQDKKSEFIRYFSYCFFFPSITVGPAINYQIFENFIQKPPKKLVNITHLLRILLNTILLISLSAVSLKFFTPYWVLQNQTYLSLPFYLQLLSLNVIGFVYRIKYYGAWGFVQIAIDLTGISWNQKTQKYDKVITGSIKFQTELNPKAKTQFWNTSVQLWLKQVIFGTLVKNTKSKTMSLVLTFLVSAFWHGIYLTYYAGFIMWAMIIIISKWAYKCSIKLPKLSNILWVRITAFVIASSIFNYTGMFMLILTWNQAIKFCQNMKFLGHFILVFLVIVSFVIRPELLSKMVKSQ